MRLVYCAFWNAATPVLVVAVGGKENSGSEQTRSAADVVETPVSCPVDMKKKERKETS